MKSKFILTIFILFFIGFAFAEQLVASGEAVVQTYSGEPVRGFYLSESLDIGLSVLILTIIFSIFYWIAKKNKFKKMKGVKKR